MMQLLCDGRYLDLYADASIQFTHDNPLFAFDDLKCERTTNFKLPSTPKNDAIFALSRMPQNYGLGMRRKYAAQLQMSGLVKDGYLYLTSFDGKDYNSIFVTGDLVGLQAVKESGKIRDIICPLDTCVWGDMYNAEDCINDWWKGVKYKQERNDHETKFPSVQLKSTIEACCSALGVQVTMPSGSEKFRYIPFEIKHHTKDGVKFASVQAVPSSPNNQANNIVDWYKVFEPCLIPIYDIYARVAYYDNRDTGNDGYCFQYEQPTTPVCYVQGWRARMKALVYGGVEEQYIIGTLRRSTGEVTTGVSYWGEGFASIMSVAEIDPFGIKTPTYDYNQFDPELFEVQAGDEFFFLDYKDVQILKTNPTQAEEGQRFHVVQIAHNGVRYADAGQPSYSIPYSVITGYKDWHWGDDEEMVVDEYEERDTIDLFSNLPECTLIDLLKAVAYMTGKVLNYTDSGGITFEDLDTTNYSRIDLNSRLTKRGELVRSFSKYARSNGVQFDSDESIFDFERLQSFYTIDNDNIEESKELGKVFASEGSAAYDEDDRSVVFLYMRNGEEDIKKPTLACAESGQEFLTRVSLPICAGLQALCDASTQIKVSVRMTALEYEQITAKTLLLVDGVLYLWTSRSWQKNEAQFTLAKVP